MYNQKPRNTQNQILQTKTILVKIVHQTAAQQPPHDFIEDRGFLDSMGLSVSRTTRSLCELSGMPSSFAIFLTSRVK